MSNTIEIIPAVLPSSFDDLREHLEPLQDVIKQVQVDIVDGRYAKGKTWPYRDRGTFDTVVAEEKGLPFWDRVDYQFDLMIEDPMQELLHFVQAGATQIILHTTSQNAEVALQTLADRRDDDVGEFNIRVGVAVGAHAHLEDLERFEAQFDFVQVMGIAREGRQGEPFEHKALYLIERLRARYRELPIQVDGGVTLDNVPRLVAAGATRLVAGSAIFGAEDPVVAYEALVAAANQPGVPT